MDEAKVEPLVPEPVQPHSYRSPVPQPTERTQVDKYGVRYRWWTDGSLRRA